MAATGYKGQAQSASCVFSSLNPIENKLLEGQRALFRIRLYVSGSMFSLGTLIVILLSSAKMTHDFRRGSFIYQLMTYVAVTLGTFAILLAPLPDDMCLTRIAMLFAMTWQVYDLTLVALYVESVNDFIFRVHCVHDGCAHTFSSGECCMLYLCSGPLLIARTLVRGCVLIGLAAIICSGSAAKMQQRMWALLAVERACMSTICVAIPVLDGVVRGRVLCPLAARFVGYGLGLYVSLSPATRGYFHRRVGELFETQRVQRSAAGIAGLIGTCTASEALALAAKRFRCIPLDRLEFSELADSSPSPRMFERSQRVSMHECDAFISHSWCDDATAKWEALQSWRQEFVQEQGREPRVWLDKCCIDQNDIEADLRCLPIFLAGCQELVVLSGTTYLTRLWCILEVFAFVHMHGDVSKITYVPVLRSASVALDTQDIKAAYRHFDARNSCCSKAEDKDRILTIIDTAFGGMGPFNSVVGAIISEARPLGTERGRMTSASSISSYGSSSGDETTEHSSCACCRRIRP